MNCPCEECLKLAICKHKTYPDLVGCEDIYNYLKIGTSFVSDYVIHKRRVKEFEQLIKPTKWRLTNETSRGYNIKKV